MGGFKFDHPPLLAPGRHFTCLSRLESICVGPFPGSKVRSELFSKLCALVDAFTKMGLPCEMLVNGSFLTGKLNPSDVDVAVIIDPDVAENMTESKEGLINDVNDNNFIEGVDAFVETLFPIGHPSFRANGNEMLWSEQYGREHNGEYLKGIAVLRIGETDVGLRIRR